MQSGRSHVSIPAEAGAGDRIIQAPHKMSEFVRQAALPQAEAQSGSAPPARPALAWVGNPTPQSFHTQAAAQPDSAGAAPRLPAAGSAGASGADRTSVGLSPEGEAAPVPLGREGEAIMAAPASVREQPGPTFRSPEQAYAIARQLVEALPRLLDRPVEILMNPEELGKVRMVMSGSETQVTLHISAERPETSDLLRRNLDLLAQDLKSLGYTQVSFDFGKRSDSPPDHRNGRETQSEPEPVTPDLPDAPPQVSRHGIDIRL